MPREGTSRDSGNILEAFIGTVWAIHPSHLFIITTLHLHRAICPVPRHHNSAVSAAQDFPIMTLRSRRSYVVIRKTR
ncbi:hypothetical protein E2C01_070661 [Portunus trituberculatus]|uniref:Uncharacterized protein n=1 Tax=Portunus trituberculatus TaxID=210409 RepID=A0A5B7I1X8_PORTR|nr:hypothetical protein [Portunus trituberculatus]